MAIYVIFATLVKIENFNPVWVYPPPGGIAAIPPLDG